MAIIDLRAGTKKADEDLARPAAGREDDPAIVALCEAINEVMSPEPKRLAEAV